jgi:AraC-like DNA-binding protein
MEDVRKFLWHKRLIGTELTPWIGHYRSFNNKTCEIPKALVSNFAICYITEGSGTLEQNGKSMPLKAGSILLRFPGISQKQRNDAGYFSECYVVLPKTTCQFFLDMNLISLDKPVLDFSLSQDIVAEFDHLLEFCEKEGPERIVLAYGRAFNFSCNLLYKVHSQGTAHLLNLERAANILSKPKEYSLTIPELAARLNLRTPTFRKMFYDHYHIPPAEFRIRKRLEQISAQLIQSDKTIKELADEYGYPNVFIFTRQFKRFVGMTPAQYRKFYTE